MVNTVYSVPVYRFNARQRAALDKPEMVIATKDEVEKYICRLRDSTPNDKSPLAMMAALLHVSSKNLTTITEFPYEKDGETYVELVETHIFLLEVPQEFRDATENDSSVAASSS